MNLNGFAIAFAPVFGNWDLFFSGNVLSGQRILGLEHGLGGAGKNSFAAMNTGTGSEIHHIVGGADGGLIMLDHNHSVAQVTQAEEGVEQAVVVSLVQSNTGFIEDVEDSHQAGADLGSETDALALSA